MKVLWRKTGAEDNYTDSAFLQGLRSNENVITYTYWSVAHQSTAVTQQLSAVAIFVGAFLNLHRPSGAPTDVALPASTLLWATSALTVLGVGCWWAWWGSNTSEGPGVGGGYGHVVKSGTVFSVLLAGLTPMLRTLTKDTSSDTIWALSSLLFMANLLFHDYESRTSVVIR
ncbi:hypothetical protein HK101_000310 [Irineochytrium annulatum]|nr:hypothetical protein HK101_000310 [Irineochytrium annulatum]